MTPTNRQAFITIIVAVILGVLSVKLFATVKKAASPFSMVETGKFTWSTVVEWEGQQHRNDIKITRIEDKEYNIVCYHVEGGATFSCVKR